MKRWIRWAAWLYPAEWRMRYGAEFDLLLGDATLRWSDLGDVIRGAIIMQTTTWMSYWKMALLAGSVGAILAFGWSLTLPNRYSCSAALEMKSPSATPSQILLSLSQADLKILGRDNLKALMLDPKLNLYPKERRFATAEDVVENDFRRHLRIVPYFNANLSSQAFRITFDYPDRYKAQASVKRLVEEFQQQAATYPEGPSVTVLENPIVPQRPYYPLRGSFAFLGAIAGASIGILAVLLWRLTNRTYAVVTMNIPKDAKRFAETQVATGQYRDLGEYVRELIRADQERRK